MSSTHTPLSDEAAMGLALAQAQAAQYAGEVPVGEYAAEVTLSAGDPYTMRVVTVRPGRVTTLSCDARYCREIVE